MRGWSRGRKRGRQRGPLLTRAQARRGLSWVSGGDGDMRMRTGGAPFLARSLDAHATCMTALPLSVSIQVPGRRPSLHTLSSPWSRKSTWPPSSIIMLVPSDSPRSDPSRTCSMAAGSVTRAATRSEPSVPCQLAKHSPTWALWSCSLSSGRPAMLVAWISALDRSAGQARWPLRGGGGCAVPRMSRYASDMGYSCTTKPARAR